MKTISFYTNAEYKELAERMKYTGERVGLDVHLYDLSKETVDQSWGKILFWKPHLVLRAMEEFQGQDILWVDADVQWQNHPTLLFQVPDDKCVACYVEAMRYLWGGLLWVRNSDGGRDMMRAWIAENEKAPDGLDDHNAFWAFMKGGYRGRIHRLPPTYCWTEVVMRRRFPTAVPVIEHELHVTVGNKGVRAQAVDRPYLE